MTPTKEQFEAAAQSAESPIWEEEGNDCRCQYFTDCGFR